VPRDSKFDTFAKFSFLPLKTEEEGNGEDSLSNILRGKKNSSGPNHPWKRFFIIFLVVILACVFSGATWAVLWLRSHDLLTIDESRLAEITNFVPKDNSLVFDMNGKKIGEYFHSYQIYVPYEKIPKKVVQAIISIEDRHFFDHKGFDPRGIVRASFSYLRRGQPTQGASTLSQQIVRHFLLTKDRTIERKIKEIFLAYQLEKKLSKKKIIEIYANALFLGNGAYGVGAAAQRYFGKRIDELSTAEAALIAGLFQSPSRLNPARYPKQAKARQELVLAAMRREGYLKPAEFASERTRPLLYSKYRPINNQTAPYFLDFVREETARLLGKKKGSIEGEGLRIYTTLDSSLQRLAEGALKQSSELLGRASDRTAQIKGQPATLEAAILSVDPTSGAIRAMIGGRDYDRSKFNRTYQSLRSPGSAFKPVVYSLALASKWKWSDVIYVSPITIKNYRPRTPDQDFLTETTLLRAFYRSMNTPTVELGEKLGLDSVLNHAKKLGIDSPLKHEFGSMLGSSDVTMLDMARLYGTFANGGSRIDPVAITEIKDQEGKTLYKWTDVSQRSTQAITPQIAYLMTAGMRAVLAMGTGASSAHLSEIAAGKTGTSNDSTDNWFCGYTSDLVSIVWVGTDEHAEIYGDTTGAKLALPIWDTLMTAASKVRGTKSFTIPTGVTSHVVNSMFGHKASEGVRMYFLNGQEPTQGKSPLEGLSHTPNESYREVFTH
jgi:1A family penicillin-binding protein